MASLVPGMIIAISSYGIHPQRSITRHGLYNYVYELDILKSDGHILIRISDIFYAYYIAYLKISCMIIQFFMYNNLDI